MHHSSARSTQLPAIIICILGLGLAGLTGCDRSEGDSEASAEANAPSESEAVAADKEAADKGAADEESADEKTDETAQKPGSATKKPAPTGSDKTDDKTGDKITDAELKKFIEVSNTLRPKQAEMKKALKNAESKSEAREAQKMVMEETRKAVEDSGLSFERFKTISQRAKSSKKLQMRLQRLAMEQKQGGK
jgi:hypothetical protein